MLRTGAARAGRSARTTASAAQPGWFGGRVVATPGARERALWRHVTEAFNVVYKKSNNGREWPVSEVKNDERGGQTG